jgi:hypothetical protein
MAVESDAIASGITSNPDGTAIDLGKDPLVAFVGWVKADEEPIKVITDVWAREWLEIPAEEVIHQVMGAERPHDEFMSVVWVFAKTKVTRRWTLGQGLKHEEATAGELAEAQLDSALKLARPDDYPPGDKPPPRHH